LDSVSKNEMMHDRQTQQQNSTVTH